MTMKLTLIASALALLVSAAQAREDQVQIHGQQAGTQTVEAAGKDGATAHYRYSDRGRGDEIKASWTLNAQGIPLRYEAKGMDYWHTPLEERFEQSAGRASWQNRVDAEENKPLAAPAFYLPANPPPEYHAVLARALLKAPGQRLALLPAGEASLRKLQTVGKGKLAATLYQISGLEFMPIPVWLTSCPQADAIRRPPPKGVKESRGGPSTPCADGSTAAVLTDWLETLPKALMPLREQMMAAQDKAAQAWHAELAKTHARKPQGDALLIRNARLFDPRDLSVREHMSVRVIGDRIVQVAEDSNVEAPSNIEVIDAQGRFLMPGLWDVHQHFSNVDGVFDLIAGVTSARDLANDNLPMMARAKRFDAGTELGPRVVLAGIVEGVGPLAGPTDVKVDTAEKARAAVDWYADHGYQQIKIYSSFKPELIAPIAERAHARGLRVSGHVPAFARAQYFVEAGADEINHLNFVLLNFFPEVRETRGKDRYTVAATKASEFNLDDPKFTEFVAFLKQHGTVLDPTMGVLENLYSGEPAKASPALRPVVQRFPVVARRQMLSGAVAVPPGHEDTYKKALPAMLRMLKRLHDSGVTIMPGTDGFAGYSLHRELELYSKAGIANAEVLRIATLTPARVLGAEADRGVIAPGKRADMVLFSGDPLKDMSDIRKVYRTIKGGRIIDPLALELALGIAKP